MKTNSFRVTAPDSLIPRKGCYAKWEIMGAGACAPIGSSGVERDDGWIVFGDDMVLGRVAREMPEIYKCLGCKHDKPHSPNVRCSTCVKDWEASQKAVAAKSSELILRPDATQATDDQAELQQRFVPEEVRQAITIATIVKDTMGADYDAEIGPFKELIRELAESEKCTYLAAMCKMIKELKASRAEINCLNMTMAAGIDLAYAEDEILSGVENGRIVPVL